MVDHRKLGRELEIFHTDPLLGAGLPIWLPAGAAARRAVDTYLYELERRAGYQHVNSPPMAKRELYERSGHLAHFGDDMFPVMRLSEGDELVLRPSLCPQHAIAYRSRQRSYRELPVRIAELGGMYRAERSGVLGGLSRVRSIFLNDAHTFCAPEQVGDEVSAVLSLMRRAHEALGVQIAGVRLSLRGSGDKYVADPGAWDRAEAMLRDALAGAGLSYVEEKGEAAFYGPKIDMQVVDPMGRQSTLATVQLDFHQPNQFDLSYVDSGGARQRPLLVHRSLVGSLERLFAHLIEVHAGAFPAWYAPVQVVVLPIGADQAGFARLLVDRCVHSGLRAEVADDGSLGSRIRDAAHRKVPYVAVVGAAEEAAGAVSLRLRDGRSLDPMPLDDAVAWLGREAAVPL